MSLARSLTTGHFRLSRAHPSFFYTLAIFAIASLGVGLSMTYNSGSLYSNPAWSIAESIVPIYYYGLFIITAVFIMALGLFFNRKLYIRVGIAMSACFYCYFGITFIFSFFAYHLNAPSGIFIWMAVGLLHLVMLLEPFTNPANRKD